MRYIRTNHKAKHYLYSKNLETENSVHKELSVALEKKTESELFITIRNLS